ncbi:MAG TPA: ABC transporter ATP-binding protein, partial [Alphaproteobacteria bacterium]|nr:ABC transporter ATP-binding protein [Alphaproteobacteria bacterium]
SVPPRAHLLLADVNRLLSLHDARWRRAVVVGLVFALLQSAATVLRPIPIKAMIEPDRPAAWQAWIEAATGPFVGRIALYTLIIVALELVILGAKIATEAAIVGMTERVIRSIRAAIVGTLLRGPYDRIGAGGPGAVLAAASGDVESVQRLLREAIVASAVSGLQIALMLAVVFFVERWLFWFLLVEIALLSAGIAGYAVWRKKRYLIKMAIDQSLLGYLATMYARNLDIRFSAIRTMFLIRALADVRKLFAINRLMWMRNSAYHGLMEFVISISAAACLIILLLTAEGGPPPIGNFLVFAYYAMLIFPCLSQIGEAWPMVLDARAALARIEANASSPLEPRPALPAPQATGGRASPSFGRIAFEDVCLLNPKGEPILDRVSFVIEPGEKVGLFGESGSGKTSIIFVLLGLHVPQQGRVTIGGRDVRELTLADRKRLFFFMRAQPAFLPGSVYDNIALTSTLADADLDQVVHGARLGGRLESTREVRQAKVSDKGEPFSGGEQQRIAIARVFLADQPCVILDESLNSLDEPTELAITQGLIGVLAEKTLILVSHRRRVAELFNYRIEVVRGGRATVVRG